MHAKWSEDYGVGNAAGSGVNVRKQHGDNPWSIGDYLARNAIRFPEKVAFYQENRQTTYAELDDRVTRLANALATLGVKHGDRVAIVARNSTECIEIFVATARLGAISAPLNFRLVIDELAHILNNLQPIVVVSTTSLFQKAEAAAASVSSVTGWVVFGPGSAEVAKRRGVHDYETLLVRASTEKLRNVVAPLDPAYILYTSGTTGRPKGAALSQAGYVVSSLNVMGRLGAGSGSVRIGGGAMFHTAGLNGALQQILVGGTSVLLDTSSFDPAQVVELIDRYRVDMAFMVPTQWQAICALPNLAGSLPSLKRVVWGASSNSRQLLERMYVTFPGVEVFAQFGQTEMTGTTCTLDAGYSLSKMGSVGKPLAHVEARIVDEKMRDVATGEVGEIVYQGPGVMLGYWRNEPATQEAMAGGWFHSGDLCRTDQDGFIYIVDRLKDMIISGGENIYSLEVEAALSTHEKVSEVAVAGAPHEKWGETPIAFVVPSDPDNPPTLAELVEYSSQRLASYKRPTGLHIVGQLPRNSTGKVLRHQLRVRSAQPDVGAAPS